jgi:hypothetical protein
LRAMLISARYHRWQRFVLVIIYVYNFFVRQFMHITFFLTKSYAHNFFLDDKLCR